MSVEYGKKGRLAPISPVVAPVVDPMQTLKDLNWRDRGLFTPVDDTVLGPIIIAQAQYKSTESPPRTKWACRPVGYDNGFVYLKYLAYGTEKLKNLKEAGVI
jgi:crotonobetainyl-CoA:carnitine CoA-transferase CaiB-like acyl-CoA transferase